MALHLITGYAGSEHITSADQGAYNIATYGGGNFVLNRGRKFAQTVLTNNSISIADGEAMLQGRYCKMAVGTSETVSIENGTQGNNRNDLICIRYEKSAVNATESTKFVVIKGTETTGTATDPTYNTGSITDGDATILDFPLYRVKLNGINIQTVDTLFSVKVSMAEYMDNYQLPVASASQLGGVKVGSGINIDGNGTISAQAYSLPTASDNTKGGVKVPTGNGYGLKVENDYLKVRYKSIGFSFNTTTLSAGETKTFSWSEVNVQSSDATILSSAISITMQTMEYDVVIDCISNYGFKVHNTKNYAVTLDGTFSNNCIVIY